VVSLLVTAVANTAANRHLTFGVRGREGLAAHHIQGLLVFALGLGITSGSLALLGNLDPRDHHGVEIVVLTAANMAVTVLRFGAMRWWIFRERSAVSTPRRRRVDA
jgi:putative flippase GtrA